MDTHQKNSIESYFSAKTPPSAVPDLKFGSDNTLPDCKSSEIAEDNEVFTDLEPINSVCSYQSQPEDLPLSLSGDLGITDLSLQMGSDSTSVPPPNLKPDLHIVGSGLANLGNTCFLNAVMQCFTHTVPLLAGVISCEHKDICFPYGEGFCVLCALSDHFNWSLMCIGKYFYPRRLVNNLHYISSSFERNHQEDAHEFLQCLLDKLENRWNDLKPKDISSEEFSECNNIVKQVFGGRLVSKLKCCNCHHCSDSYEPLVDVSLEIEDADTLPGALKSFTRVEKIEDTDTKFTCENCKEQVFVEKQLLLDQAPTVAAFHLKRFKNNGCNVEKIKKYVAFPLELDLSDYTAGCQTQKSELMYDLYAVVVHIGNSPNAGHYYCFIRSAPHTWYRLDDEEVTWVHEELVLSSEAYILFYAKKGIPSFSNFIETQKQYIDKALQTSPKSVLDHIDAGLPSTSPPSESGVGANATSGPADVVFVKKIPENKENIMPVAAPAENKENIMPVAASAENKENVIPFAAQPLTSISHMTFPCTALDPQNSSARKENISKYVTDLTHRVNVTPTRLTRSPSPEIYREDPEQLYTIPRNHLMRSAEKSSCKRQLNNEIEDVRRKEARTYVKRSMSGSRSQQFMALISGQGSPIKKKGRRFN